MAQIQDFSAARTLPVKKYRTPSEAELAKVNNHNGRFPTRGTNWNGRNGRKVYVVEYVRGGLIVRSNGSPLPAGREGHVVDSLRFHGRYNKPERLIEHEKEVALATLLGTREGREGFWAKLFDLRWNDTRLHVEIGPRGDSTDEGLRSVTRRVRLGHRVHFVVELVREPEASIVSTFDSLCGRYIGVSSETTFEEAQPYRCLEKVYDIVEREDFCAACAGLVLEQKL